MQTTDGVTRMRAAADDDDARADALLRRVGEGDAAAFSELYDAFAPSVFGLAGSVARSPELAEEVTQDVFLWVWRSARSFDQDRGSAAALIHTVARRRAIDAVRREAAARRREQALQETELQRAARTYDLESGVEDADQVEALLARLTDLQREAVELSFYEDLSGEEVARRLGVKLATAKSRKRDGLMRMRWAAEQLAL